MKLIAHDKNIIQYVVCPIGCISFFTALIIVFFQVIITKLIYIKKLFESHDPDAISGFAIISLCDAAAALDTVFITNISPQARNSAQ
jgi:hypothetical protein